MEIDALWLGLGGADVVDGSRALARAMTMATGPRLTAGGRGRWS